MRKSWSTVSNSPGALCRISSSVAGLIPGERTSATPRSVLQISDRYLRRYPIRSVEENLINRNVSMGRPPLLALSFFREQVVHGSMVRAMSAKLSENELKGKISSTQQIWKELEAATKT